MDPVLLLLASAGAGSAVAGMLGMVHRPGSGKRTGEHPVRQQILSALEQRPGASITELCAQIGSGWGTVQHHLYVMRKTGLIKGVATGRSHRMFSTVRGAGPALNHLALLLRGRVLDLVKTVVDEPGIGQRKITDRIGMSRKVLRGYANLLKDAGLLEEVAQSKYRYYYPTGALKAVLAQPEVAAIFDGHGDGDSVANGAPLSPGFD